jgi:regulator of sigma E protease
MLFIIIAAFVCLVVLLVLHELSHFLTAKKIGVKVEEFGLGYPPRLIAKKMGETVYSLNLIPFGAFVRISEKELKSKPFYQRAAVILAGVVSFWLICALLIALISAIGFPFQVSDKENIPGAYVQIVEVASPSPARAAGLRSGDLIESIADKNGMLKIDKIGQVQSFSRARLGQEIMIKVKRGGKELDFSLKPRSKAPQGQGPLGIALVRVAERKYSWPKALLVGFSQTFKMTGLIVVGLFQGLARIASNRPSGMELVGPVGIFDIFVKSSRLGLVYFVRTIALISLNLSVFNALPIPMTDGGKLLFLTVEKIRRKPFDQNFEKRIETAFFLLLISLMVWVTIKDISRLI